MISNAEDKTAPAVAIARNVRQSHYHSFIPRCFFNKLYSDIRKGIGHIANF